MNSIHTLRGDIAIFNDLVSLTDMYKSVGVTLRKLHPTDWATQFGQPVMGDCFECFADTEVALAYAAYLSPYLLTELAGRLKGEVSTRPACCDSTVLALANHSRRAFCDLIKRFGFGKEGVFYKLTNLIYSQTLTSNINSLRAQYKCAPTESIRSKLDQQSLSLVVKTETLFVLHAAELSAPTLSEIIRLIDSSAQAARAIQLSKAGVH